MHWCPYFCAHVLSGILLLLAIVLAFRARRALAGLPKEKLISVVLMASMAVGIHGLLHRRM